MKKHRTYIYLILYVFLSQTACIRIGYAQDESTPSLSPIKTRSNRAFSQTDMLERGAEAISLLRQNINDPDEAVRIRSIMLLSDLRARDAVPDLIRHLRETNDIRTIYTTSFALGRIQDQRALPELIETASSLSAEINRRQAAVIGLGLLGNSDAVPTLETILEDNSLLLRVYAAGSLGLLGSFRGLDVALEGIKYENQSIRRHAIQALGLIGSEKAIDILEGISSENSSRTEKRAAELSLFQIGVHDLDEYNKIRILKESVLSSPRPSTITKWCIDELFQIGNDNAKAAMTELSLSHKNRTIRAMAEKMADLLNTRNKMKKEGANVP